ncbi:hypothetical protein lbkm_2510 [Lachnospiraceae bacterium KM106-2]|nr:hypothetical protein lbkm_2510 [Lachnospiraceae bacterium KM106-2]
MSMTVKKVTDAAFRKYGRVLTKDYEVEELLKVMETKPVPDDVIYVPSDEDLEKTSTYQVVRDSLYGGLPIQIGYCNGHNQLLNAVEYHRSSEINVAATDLILILGMEQDIEEDLTYDTSKMEAFLVPEGTVIEVYATTLHYAPCGVAGKGFRCVVALPKDTNLDLENKVSASKEDSTLYARNKWLIAHKSAAIDGAFVGLKGENLSAK